MLVAQGSASGLNMGLCVWRGNIWPTGGTVCSIWLYCKRQDRGMNSFTQASWARLLRLISSATVSQILIQLPAWNAHQECDHTSHTLPCYVTSNLPPSAQTTWQSMCLWEGTSGCVGLGIQTQTSTGTQKGGDTGLKMGDTNTENNLFLWCHGSVGQRSTHTHTFSQTADVLLNSKHQHPGLLVPTF